MRVPPELEVLDGSPQQGQRSLLAVTEKRGAQNGLAVEYFLAPAERALTTPAELKEHVTGRLASVLIRVGGQLLQLGDRRFEHRGAGTMALPARAPRRALVCELLASTTSELLLERHDHG